MVVVIGDLLDGEMGGEGKDPWGQLQFAWLYIFSTKFSLSKHPRFGIRIRLRNLVPFNIAVAKLSE